MGAPRRRSARLSRKSSTPDKLGAGKSCAPVHLEPLVERDETPEGGPQPTLDAILSSPAAPIGAALSQKIDELSAVKTPTTVPRVAHEEMNPKEIHRSTTKAPDSGLRLGFVDISAAKNRNTLAAAQNTPTRSISRASLPQHLTAASFDFKFASEPGLSEDARKLMDDVRVDAERIKSHIRAEKDTQAPRDFAAERLFSGLHATGRKIAKPQGKAGRFSDVHMAQFKKMDSIANHPSSFRARPNFAQPTKQSLKRSGSKAGLDEIERSRTAGKGTPGRPTPLIGFIQRKTQTSQPAEASERDNDGPAKRRKSTVVDDVVVSRAAIKRDGNATLRESSLPRTKIGAPTSLVTPTKASFARPNAGKLPLASPSKVSFLPRSNSVKALSTAADLVPSTDDNARAPSPPKPVSLVRSESTKSVRPLPPIPTNASSLAAQSAHSLTTSKPLPATPFMSSSPNKVSMSSKLPTFQGLKSILRSTRKQLDSSTIDTSAGGTPKRSNTAAPSESGSTKKVDFTPSTKSRYAVKLAAASPSPSKLTHSSSMPTSGPVVAYDPAAYTLEHDSDEDEWEDAESEVNYPVLPTLDESITSTPDVAPLNNAFIHGAREHSRGSSKEFKSIFTTLEHPSRSNTPTTLSDVKTNGYVRRAAVIPHHQANDSVIVTKPKPSPSTIRPVRSSGVSNLIKPFQDTIKTFPHGLPGKKRRRESQMEHCLQHLDDDDDGKENRRSASTTPNLPGAWDDGMGKNDEQQEDEGIRRGAKRVKMEIEPKTRMTMTMGAEGKVVKKPNRAREAAARNAKERKGAFPGQKQPTAERRGVTGKGEDNMAGRTGILTMSRLNVLSRPKERR